MKVVFISYNPGGHIPVEQYLRNKKLRKYFSREAEAAVVAVAELTKGIQLDPETPFYYSLGIIEYENYGLQEITRGSRDEHNSFSNRMFIERGLPEVSPLNQFKVLQNMPLSYISIEYGLTGDNAVIYSSARGLLIQALYSLTKENILLGASKAYQDGKIEVGFALVSKAELKNSPYINSEIEAIAMFREWSKDNPAR